MRVTFYNDIRYPQVNLFSCCFEIPMSLPVWLNSLLSNNQTSWVFSILSLQTQLIVMDLADSNLEPSVFHLYHFGGGGNQLWRALLFFQSSYLWSMPLFCRRLLVVLLYITAKWWSTGKGSLKSFRSITSITVMIPIADHDDQESNALSHFTRITAYCSPHIIATCLVFTAKSF